MNINNQRLSCRQRGRLLFFDYIALPFLLLPQRLAGLAGEAGWLCLLFGDVCGYVFLCLILRITNVMQMHNSESDALTRRHLAKNPFVCASALAGAFAALTSAAASLWLLARIVCVYLLQAVSVWLVLILAVLLTCYGMAMGAESRGRRYELLYVWVMAAFVGLLLFAADGMDMKRLWMHESLDPIHLLSGGALAAVGQIVSVTLLLHDGKTQEMKSGEYRRAVRAAFWRASLLQLLFYLVLVGNFGAPTLAVLDAPILELGAAIRMSVGFLERQDALLCGIFLLPLFAFAENRLSDAHSCFRLLCRRSMEKETDG